MKFLSPLNEEKLNEFNLDFDPISGNEIINFDGHKFEIIRNNNSLVEEITFSNQCTKTYNIEDSFIELISLLVEEDEKFIIFDSNGHKEEMTKDEF